MRPLYHEDARNTAAQTPLSRASSYSFTAVILHKSFYCVKSANRSEVKGAASSALPVCLHSYAGLSATLPTSIAYCQLLFARKK